MLIVKNKILAIILMLLVSVGQTASAAEVSCNMDINQVTMEQDMDVSCMKDMDMSSQNRPDDAADDTTDCSNANMAEYCDLNCHCPSGDVTSAILLATPNGSWEMALLQKNTKSPYLIIMQFPTALYRPPISL
ncbi:hypothetical protein MNBD_ALPHA01-844 [hydrothermal vent metagenome]|uniref:Uncharacterized protein n=1 Tax=hydrothermal vent metagenome TaxID=652676 RepID=A0A3B0S895_9ZZZZ